MNPYWQSFLVQHGATIEAGVVQRFGNISAELISTRQGTVLCDLGQFGTLRVSGEDAQSFLQNLLSNDIRDVSNARAQLSSFNTAKGRMLATLLIWREGNDYLLQLPRVLSEPMRKKLGMYVLRAKVKIADAGDETVSLGLSGANAQEILTVQFGEMPLERLAITHPSTSSGRTEKFIGSIIKIGDTRFQVNTGAQQAQSLWNALSKHAQPAGSVCWDWLNIRSGIPVILPQTQEQFVAQMVNYDGIGGVSFKKGCYPGQEIVARMQYLGHLKRRMYLAHLDSNDIPQAGDELFSMAMEGQASGMIVNASPAPGGGCDVLAVVQIASREAQTIHWKSLHGAALQILPTPCLPPDA
ncbi:MAG: folate-binding protein YgfZ [Nitrosomonadales bacterium]|nr:folate-binding protein YgfZ [Nitrosomonadales bacterium]